MTKSTTSTISARSIVTTLMVGALLVAAATAADARRIAIPSPYIIEGYLDRAPPEAKVIDRVEVFSSGRAKRWLLVTSYRAPGEISLDRYLSWPLEHTYAVSGKRDEVARLFEAPAGAQIKGTFLVYARAYPTLVISELDAPPA